MCLLFIIISPDVIAKATPGIDYRKITTENKQTVHVLEVDPKLISINLVRAKDLKHSRESVIDIAKHYHAIAAINGGFFRVNEQGEGCPAGLLKINRKLYGIAYKARAAIGWDNQTNITLIDRIQTKTTIDINQQPLPINAMNSLLTTNHAVLYSDNYDRKHLIFDTNAIHFIINDNKITDIQRQHTIKIPSDGYVYSVDSNLIPNLPTINIGDQVSINSQLIPLLNPTDAQLWETVPFILSGAPLLLKDNIKITDYNPEGLRGSFINEPYARTAIGILNNGNWLLAVAEKNVTHGTAGLTVPELATVMQELGCNNALNLDGGGSSTMYYNNRLINHPEGDEDESLGFATIRKVSDAIVLLPKS